MNAILDTSNELLTGGKDMSFLKCDWVKLGLFAAGTLFGTAGIKVLSSKDAKNAYTHATAAVLRAKDTVMDTTTRIQENCADIYEGAKQINDDRAAAEGVYEDETADAKVCEAEPEESDTAAEGDI